MNVCFPLEMFTPSLRCHYLSLLDFHRLHIWLNGTVLLYTSGILAKSGVYSLLCQSVLPHILVSLLHQRIAVTVCVRLLPGIYISAMLEKIPCQLFLSVGYILKLG